MLLSRWDSEGLEERIGGEDGKTCSCTDIVESRKRGDGAGCERGCGGGVRRIIRRVGDFWEREKHFMAHGGVLKGHKLAVLCLAVGGGWCSVGRRTRVYVFGGERRLGSTRACLC
ncbi:unnamed protein product [Ilex paraguariensis]|uniref:Uncharacterized protein n=1 Tax=Ilex paraguariensis TaxID=185542 RepID=A0ABC8R721_9AQUA